MFQSLIGKIQTVASATLNISVVGVFQSLIGKIQTINTRSKWLKPYLFQSLIGKIQTRADYRSPGIGSARFNPS